MSDSLPAPRRGAVASRVAATILIPETANARASQSAASRDAERRVGAQNGDGTPASFRTEVLQAEQRLDPRSKAFERVEQRRRAGEQSLEAARTEAGNATVSTPHVAADSAESSRNAAASSATRSAAPRAIDAAQAANIGGSSARNAATASNAPTLPNPASGTSEAVSTSSGSTTAFDASAPQPRGAPGLAITTGSGALGASGANLVSNAAAAAAVQTPRAGGAVAATGASSSTTSNSPSPNAPAQSGATTARGDASNATLDSRGEVTGAAKSRVGVAKDAPGQTGSSAADALEERILQFIRTRAAGDRATTIMRLDPPELGQIRVTVLQQQQSVQLRIDSDQAMARQLLTQHSDALQRALERSGLTLDQFEVRAPESAEPSSSSFGDARGRSEQQTTQQQSSWYAAREELQAARERRRSRPDVLGHAERDRISTAEPTPSIIDSSTAARDARLNLIA